MAASCPARAAGCSRPQIAPPPPSECDGDKICAVSSSEPRALDDITPDEVDFALTRLAQLVEGELPASFEAGEGQARYVATLLLVRMAQVARAIGTLVRAGHPTEAFVLLRSLYEHMVVLAWVCVSPEERAARWIGAAHKRGLTLFHESQRYGLGALSDEQVASLEESAASIPKVQPMAHEVDGFWPEHIPGFRAWISGVHEDNVLTVAGLYTVIYRNASALAHGEGGGIQGITAEDERGRPVIMLGTDPVADLVGLAVPLFVMGLQVYEYRFERPAGGAAEEILVRFVHGTGE